MLRVLAALLLIVPLAALAAEPERLALVVGASDYEQDRASREAAGFLVPPRLHNAVRDAELVSEALAGAGFTVARLDNPSRRQLVSGIGQLAQALRAAGDDAVGVFYFAGHGAQGRPPLERDVDNYLIPVGAYLQTEIDLEAEAVGLSRVSAMLSGSGADAVVIILDACRDFALPQVDRSSFTSRGLVEARARPRTIVAYSTAPGDVADDGPPGGNGPYATALARGLREARGARLEDIFYRVRLDVLAVTEGDQQPWENSSLIEPVVIGEPEVVLQDPTMPRSDPYGGRDVAVFGAIRDSRMSQDYAIFLEDFPESPFVPYVRNRLALLKEGETRSTSVLQAPNVAVEPAPRGPPPDAIERALALSRYDRRLVQLALNDLGHQAGAVDGLFGPRTRSAVADWQRTKNYARTGYLDEEQMAFLVERGRGIDRRLGQERPPPSAAEPVPIAVTHFFGSTPAAEQGGRAIAKLVSADLERSALFRPIERSALAHIPVEHGDKMPSFTAWRRIAAQMLVTGAVHGGEAGGELVVEFRLWNVPAGAHIRGQRLETTSANWRRIAHMIADTIQQTITGGRTETSSRTGSSS